MTKIDRRVFLIGGSAAVVAACSDDSSDPAVSPTVPLDSEPVVTAVAPSDPVDTVSGAELSSLTPAQFVALPICAVLPSTTAGPFPTADPLNRRDVTEGYPGHPLRLGMRVVDADCEPIPGADIEIWHADASGDYSAFEDGGSGKDEGAGTTFLRGFQTTNTDGIAEFQTIYPGWYGGRAVHIHVTARVDGSHLLTSQIYFEEAYTEQIFATGEYAQFGSPDRTWATDSLAVDPATDGSGITLTAAPTSLGDGTLGLINIGVPA